MTTPYAVKIITEDEQNAIANEFEEFEAVQNESSVSEQNESSVSEQNETTPDTTVSYNETVGSPLFEINVQPTPSNPQGNTSLGTPRFEVNSPRTPTSPELPPTPLVPSTPILNEGFKPAPVTRYHLETPGKEGTIIIVNPKSGENTNVTTEPISSAPEENVVVSKDTPPITPVADTIRSMVYDLLKLAFDVIGYTGNTVKKIIGGETDLDVLLSKYKCVLYSSGWLLFTSNNREYLAPLGPTAKNPPKIAVNRVIKWASVKNGLDFSDKDVVFLYNHFKALFPKIAAFNHTIIVSPNFIALNNSYVEFKPGSYVKEHGVTRRRLLPSEQVDFATGPLFANIIKLVTGTSVVSMQEELKTARKNISIGKNASPYSKSTESNPDDTETEPSRLGTPARKTPSRNEISELFETLQQNTPPLKKVKEEALATPIRKEIIMGLQQQTIAYMHNIEKIQTGANILYQTSKDRYQSKNYLAQVSKDEKEEIADAWNKLSNAMININKLFAEASELQLELMDTTSIETAENALLRLINIQKEMASNVKIINYNYIVIPNEELSTEGKTVQIKTEITRITKAMDLKYGEANNLVLGMERVLSNRRIVGIFESNPETYKQIKQHEKEIYDDLYRMENIIGTTKRIYEENINRPDATLKDYDAARKLIYVLEYALEDVEIQKGYYHEFNKVFQHLKTTEKTIDQLLNRYVDKKFRTLDKDQIYAKIMQMESRIEAVQRKFAFYIDQFVLVSDDMEILKYSYEARKLLAKHKELFDTIVTEINYPLKEAITIITEYNAVPYSVRISLSDADAQITLLEKIYSEAKNETYYAFEIVVMGKKPPSESLMQFSGAPLLLMQSAVKRDAAQAPGLMDLSTVAFDMYSQKQKVIVFTNKYIKAYVIMITNVYNFPPYLDRKYRDIAVAHGILTDHPDDIAKVAELYHGRIASLKRLYLENVNHLLLIQREESRLLDKYIKGTFDFDYLVHTEASLVALLKRVEKIFTNVCIIYARRLVLELKDFVHNEMVLKNEINNVVLMDTLDTLQSDTMFMRFVAGFVKEFISETAEHFTITNYDVGEESRLVSSLFDDLNTQINIYSDLCNDLRIRNLSTDNTVYEKLTGGNDIKSNATILYNRIIDVHKKFTRHVLLHDNSIEIIKQFLVSMQSAPFQFGDAPMKKSENQPITKSNAYKKRFTDDCSSFGFGYLKGQQEALKERQEKLREYMALFKPYNVLGERRKIVALKATNRVHELYKQTKTLFAEAIQINAEAFREYEIGANKETLFKMYVAAKEKGYDAEDRFTDIINETREEFDILYKDKVSIEQFM